MSVQRSAPTWDPRLCYILVNDRTCLSGAHCDNPDVMFTASASRNSPDHSSASAAPIELLGRYRRHTASAALRQSRRHVAPQMTLYFGTSEYQYRTEAGHRDSVQEGQSKSRFLYVGKSMKHTRQSLTKLDSEHLLSRTQHLVVA